MCFSFFSVTNKLAYINLRTFCGCQVESKTDSLRAHAIFYFPMCFYVCYVTSIGKPYTSILKKHKDSEDEKSTPESHTHNYQSVDYSVSTASRPPKKKLYSELLYFLIALASFLSLSAIVISTIKAIG